MNRAEVNQRLKEFQERCRALGLSVTYQRLEIYRALLRLEGHPSPDDVYQLVKRAYPSISLATIYKTLERLERAGLIAKPNIIHETARYEHRTSHHHHLVCTGCKRLEDLAPEELRSRLPRDAQELGLP
ncbi:MAG TPA: transcriptional repressor, partial [Planctomycetota bacterium]|nr:transcriptional repressor [Planctomycetota bacterium]